MQRDVRMTMPKPAKLLWLVLACVVAMGSARAAEKLSPMKTLAFNNFHHEMVKCLTYYILSIQGLKASDDEKWAAEGQKVVDALTVRILTVGKLLGLKDETAPARMRMASRKQMQDIDNSLINFSILIDKYGEPCKTVVENPDSRVEYWMKKAATDLAR